MDPADNSDRNIEGGMPAGMQSVCVCVCAWVFENKTLLWGMNVFNSLYGVRIWKNISLFVKYIEYIFE